VVDCIKLTIVNKLHQMREFHRNDAGRLQSDFETGNKIIQIGDVGQDVVADENVGGSMLQN